MKLKVKIQKLMSQGNIDKIISSILKLKLDSDTEDEMIIISARWERLKKENRLGTISKNSFDQESNIIIVTLQELVNRLDFFIPKPQTWSIVAIIVGLSIFAVLPFFLVRNLHLWNKRSEIALPKEISDRDTSTTDSNTKMPSKKDEVAKSQPSKKLQKDSFEIEGVIIDSLGIGIGGLEIHIDDKFYCKSQENGSFKLSLTSNGGQDYRIHIQKHKSILKYQYFRIGDDLTIVLP